MKSSSPRIERLLLVRNDRIGDLVLSLPAFAAARKALPHARLTALVSPLTAPLLRGNVHLDQVLIDDPSLSGWALGRRLRRQCFDAALVMAAYPRNCLAAWSAGIPLRVTWGYKPSAVLLGNRRVFTRRSHPPLHESEFALAFVKRLFPEAAIDASTARLTIDPAARARVRKRLAADLGTAGPLFGVHPGNSGSAFNWPAARYAELVALLAEQGRVIVTGGPCEEALLADVRRLAKLAPEARVGFYQDFSLPELVAALADLDVLIVSSTGPMHVAGVLGTPIVALFSRHPSHAPEKWRPLGERHVLLQPEPGAEESAANEPLHGERHMARISVQTALAAIHGLIPQEIEV